MYTLCLSSGCLHFGPNLRDSKRFASSFSSFLHHASCHEGNEGNQEGSSNGADEGDEGNHEGGSTSANESDESHEGQNLHFINPGNHYEVIKDPRMFPGHTA